MFKKIHVYDLDGVLVDTSHRYRTKSNGAIDLAYWFANRTEEKIKQDKLLPLAKQYVLDCINSEIYTVLCTAREYHPIDLQFIVGCLGYPDKLIMRMPGNNDPDYVYKRRELQRLFNLKQFQKLTKRFWDDNTRNLYAVADLGVHCYHVQKD